MEEYTSSRENYADVGERVRRAVENLKKRMRENPRLLEEAHLHAYWAAREFAEKQRRDLLRVIDETRFTRFTG